MFAAGVGWIDERAATTGLTGSWSESVAYKGVWRHEMRKETTELQGFQAALSTEANNSALAALGLDRIAAALWDANEAVKTAMDARNAERGERAEARADGSVPELHKATADLLCQCAKRVNALYMITPSEDVAKVIKAAYGVVEQYRHVAAQPAKHKTRSPRPRRKTGGTRPRRVPSRQTNFNKPNTRPQGLQKETPK